jgi:hypothetical protein
MAASILWIDGATYNVVGIGWHMLAGILTVPPTTPGTSAAPSLMIILQSNVVSATTGEYHFGFNPTGGSPSLGMPASLTSGLASVAASGRGAFFTTSVTNMPSTLTLGGTIDLMINITSGMPQLQDHGMIAALIVDHQSAAPFTDAVWTTNRSVSSVGGTGPRSTTYSDSSPLVPNLSLGVANLLDLNVAPGFSATSATSAATPQSRGNAGGTQMGGWLDVEPLVVSVPPGSTYTWTWSGTNAPWEIVPYQITVTTHATPPGWPLNTCTCRALATMTFPQVAIAMPSLPQIVG